MAAPEKLLILHEDFEGSRFQLVGRFGSGNQFMAFVTGAYPKDWWSGKYSPEYVNNCWAWHKRWYAVLHKFDSEGNHLGTAARCGGTSADGQWEAMARADEMLEQLLISLGDYEFCDIAVKMFSVEIDDYFFGLVYQLNNYDDPANPDATYECVMLEPNDIMFHPPWDSGEYST